MRLLCFGPAFFLINIALRPLQRLRNFAPALETWIDVNLTEEDRASLCAAMENRGVRIGQYYALYAAKKLIASSLRRRSRTRLFKLSRLIDRTDYSRVLSGLSESRGLIIALPHYGHYVVSAINIMEQLREYRSVYMLYGRPDHHPGNELFDDLSRTLFDDGDCGAYVLHSDARGLATALRALKNGSILITMPDVCTDIRSSYAIPFLDRQLDMMLGTAGLARRSGAALIPALAISEAPLRTKTVFGKPVMLVPSTDEEVNQSNQTKDYSAMLELFAFFEAQMSDQPLHWQYVRTHFSVNTSFPALSTSEVNAAWDVMRDGLRSPISPLDVVVLDQ